MNSERLSLQDLLQIVDRALLLHHPYLLVSERESALDLAEFLLMVQTLHQPILCLALLLIAHDQGTCKQKRQVHGFMSVLLFVKKGLKLGNLFGYLPLEQSKLSFHLLCFLLCLLKQLYNIVIYTLTKNRVFNNLFDDLLLMRGAELFGKVQLNLSVERVLAHF